MENIFKLVNQFIEENKYTEAIEQLNKLHKQYPANGEIIVKRADLFYKLQKYTDALNDYNQSLKYANKHSDEVKAKIEIITNIIKYQGSDIYAATNLHNDPWLDE
ncbi:MAG: tetratricopeptide repeat protein [Bacteroidota bacterium]|nr:tetratricopeptide repeat protein [Bacteroidota bacterium]